MKPFFLGQYEKSMPNDFSLSEKLKLSKKTGFDYLELSIDETDEKLSRIYLHGTDLLDFKKTIEDSGQPIRSICLSGHRKYPLGSLDDKTVEKSLDISKRAIEFAANLGIRNIQLAGYDVYYETSCDETQKRFLENLIKTTEFAASYGVGLGFETMETSFMNTCEKAVRYVNLVSSPYLNIYPDIGNIRNATQDVVSDLKKGKGHIIAAHLKETKEGVFRDLPFGTGRTPYKEAITELLSQGVRMFVLEFWYAKGQTPSEYVKAGYNYINEKFNEVLGFSKTSIKPVE